MMNETLERRITREQSAEIEKLREEKKVLDAALFAAFEVHTVLSSNLKIATEALEFYAEPFTWSRVYADASEALVKIRE